MSRFVKALAGCLAVGAVGAAVVQAQISSEVPAANQRSGSPDTIIAPGWSLTKLAEGIDPLENPSGDIIKYGYLNDGPGTPANRNQPTRTEPDINTYLAPSYNLGGPAAGFDYGRHYLFQGHENATGNGYVTRINLDVPRGDAHRITLLTPVDGAGNTGISRADGSTYYPFAKKLLVTMEGNGSTTGGVFQVPVDYAPGYQDPTILFGIIGRGGFEGIHPDDQGNLTLAEDIGGGAVSADKTDPNPTTKAAKAPNSFIYRFVPTDTTNLQAGGKLYALQVDNGAGAPITFHGHGGGTDDAAGKAPCTGAQAGVAAGGGSKDFCDAWAQDQLELYKPGGSLRTHWVLVHDTAIDGTATFNANALAKTANATPFKRPETTAFLPRSGFRSFYFTPTGDTNAGAAPLAAAAAWGAVMHVELDSSTPTSAGRITPLVIGDQTHNSFDNITMLDDHTALVGEDRGDSLHQQLNTLDSAWSVDIESGQLKRFVALGRDPSATADAPKVGTPGFQNDGDNEVTGLFVSDGSMSAQRIVGWAEPGVNARGFFTQQHGDNTTYEFSPPTNQGPKGDDGDDGHDGHAANDGREGRTAKDGAEGKTGSAGPGGPAGARGPRGHTGTVTCAKTKGQTVCKLAAARRASARSSARLVRGRTVYAAGTASRMVARRAVRAGRYTVALRLSHTRTQRLAVTVR